MNSIPPSRFRTRKNAQKKWHTSTVSSAAGLRDGNCDYSKRGEGNICAWLSIRVLVIGMLEEVEHCLTVTSCCRPCSWWYTISKVSLKHCKGEAISVLSYLSLAPFYKGPHFCLPVFLPEALGLCCFWDICYPLQILQLSAAPRESAVPWRGASPSHRTAVLAAACRKRTRGFFSFFLFF